MIFPIINRGKKAGAPSLTDRLAETMTRSQKILFVDDDANLLAMIGEIASAYNVRILLASSIHEARDVLAAERPASFAGIILDVKLTNGDGVALYREIAVAAPEVEVVFLSGYVDEALVQRIGKVGPARVFSKTNVGRPDFVEKFFAQLGVRRLVGASSQPIFAR